MKSWKLLFDLKTCEFVFAESGFCPKRTLFACYMLTTRWAVRTHEFYYDIQRVSCPFAPCDLYVFESTGKKTDSWAKIKANKSRCVVETILIDQKEKTQHSSPNKKAKKKQFNFKRMKIAIRHSITRDMGANENRLIHLRHVLPSSRTHTRTFPHWSRLINRHTHHSLFTMTLQVTTSEKQPKLK